MLILIFYLGIICLVALICGIVMAVKSDSFLNVCVSALCFIFAILLVKILLIF